MTRAPAERPHSSAALIRGSAARARHAAVARGADCAEATREARPASHRGGGHLRNYARDCRATYASGRDAGPGCGYGCGLRLRLQLRLRLRLRMRMRMRMRCGCGCGRGCGCGCGCGLRLRLAVAATVAAAAAATGVTPRRSRLHYGRRPSATRGRARRLARRARARARSRRPAAPLLATHRAPRARCRASRDRACRNLRR